MPLVRSLAQIKSAIDCVLALLEVMQGPMLKEQKEDANAYDKLAWWCEAAEAEKRKAIADALKLGSIELLGEEQGDDLAELEQCRADLKLAENEKELDRSIMLLEKAIDHGKTAIVTLADEFAALVAGTMALGKEAAERTDVREEENSGCITVMALHETVHEFLGFAKNGTTKSHKF